MYSLLPVCRVWGRNGMDREVLTIVSPCFFADMSEFLSAICERGLLLSLHWYLVVKPTPRFKRRGEYRCGNHHGTGMGICR